ncbi:I78 family peptidase inhibitor [Streptomyces sp. TRM 70351]|uniref:I78 family peptidase inhibitor n=1 Tax=Streptomyces sp. TRM 70351 TaxID=3116552 RepID=UPI002E7C485D|nr:I78 family peptidase inhibitor [Streptomyces sp. TRM 70351]MEE1929271.1 I78 family peptidase inhibitor [Streptomyces sp. TRM 70351]
MAQIPLGSAEPDDDPEAYAGMPVQDAGELARSRGWSTVRTLPPDAVITMEYQAGRLNLTVENDTVLRSWKG